MAIAQLVDKTANAVEKKNAIRLVSDLSKGFGTIAYFCMN